MNPHEDVIVIFSLSSRVSQSIECSRKINHERHRQIVWCFITKGFVFCLAKTLSSLYVLAKNEWNLHHILGLFLDVLSVDLAALVVYQLVFSAFCVKQRYEALVVYANEYLSEFEIRKAFADSVENNQFIDNVANLNSELADVLSKINSTFSKQV